MGVVKGVGSAFVRRDEGTFMGLYWWARERGVTRTEAKGGKAEATLIAAHPLQDREHSVPALPAVFPITNTGQRGLWSARDGS